MTRKYTEHERESYSSKTEELLEGMSSELIGILEDRPLVSTSHESLSYASDLRERVFKAVDPFLRYLSRQDGWTDGEEVINEILPMTSEASKLDRLLSDTTDFESFPVQFSFQVTMDEISRLVRYIQSVKGGSE